MHGIRLAGYPSVGRYFHARIYFVLATLLLYLILSTDRTNLLDNDNYIESFSNQSVLSEFFQRLSGADSLLHKVAQFFSEELLWLVYTQVVGAVLNPTLSVYFTALLLNCLIVYSCFQFRPQNGITALLLWVLLPVAASVLGLYQIRQGLAFSLFILFYARGWNLALGALIAAMVHTTFIVPFAMLLVLSWKAFRTRPMLSVCVLITLGCLLSFYGNVYFDQFGGRRTDTYAVNEGAKNINFLIVGFLALLPSLVLAFNRGFQTPENTDEVALMNVGVFIWITCCFFLFPIGTTRIDYFPSLFSIFPVLAAGRELWKKYPLVMILYGAGILILVWGGVRDDMYDFLFPFG